MLTALAGALCACTTSSQARGHSAGQSTAVVSTPAPAATTTGAPHLLDATDVTGRALPSKGVVTLASVQRSAPGVAFGVHTLTVGDVRRAYLVAAPAHQSGPLPMIVVLQGVHAPVTQEVERDEFLPLVAQGRAVLVYPAGYLESWNAGDGCCGAAVTAKLDDTAFVRAAVADAQRQLSVDTARTYLVGFSNGGKLAYEVVCAQPDLFAAFAVVAAVPIEPCAGSRSSPPVSLLTTVGTLDHDLPLRHHGKPPLQQMGTALAAWRERDGCSDEVTGEHSLDTATITTYGDCAGGAEVVGVVYEGLAHKWPESSLVGSRVSAAALIWPFLSAHRLD